MTWVPTGKEQIESSWRAAGIIDVLKLDTKQLSSFGSYDDLDPMVTAVEITQQEQLLVICNLPREDIIQGQCQPEIKDKWKRMGRGQESILFCEEFAVTI